MTDRTLREQIAGTLASFFHDHHGQLLAAADAIIQEFCTLDAHTAQPAVDVSEPHVDEHQRGLSVADERQKPAPDAVAEARAEGWFAQTAHGFHYCPSCNPKEKET